MVIVFENKNCFYWPTIVIRLRYNNIYVYRPLIYIIFFQKKNKDIEIGTWSEYGENEPESISSYDYIIIKRA